MNFIKAILVKELRSYFNSPVAYVVYAVYFVITGLIFYVLVSGYNNSASSAQLNMNDQIITNFFVNQGNIFLLLIPIITMRLLADENKSGTIELLMTVPIRQFHIITGKFLACFFFYALMLSGTLLYQLTLAIFGNPDPAPIIAGYTGCLLLGAAFLSMGVFASSVTKNQIIAAILAFGIILTFWFIGISADSDSVVSKITTALSASNHFQEFTQGAINTADITYYLSQIFFWLFLTYVSLESLRWRES